MGIEKLFLSDYITLEKFEEVIKDQDDPVFVIGIAKETIDEKADKYINSWFDVIVDSPSAAKIEFIITTVGYEDVEKEIYQIKEVREYLNKACDYQAGALTRINIESLRAFVLCYSIKEVLSKNNNNNFDIAIDNTKLSELINKVKKSSVNKEDFQRFEDNILKILKG